MVWTTWWIWIAAGFVLAGLEVLIPGFIFLGFAAGAVLTGLMLWLGIWTPGLPGLVLVFSVLSLVAWFAMRTLLGVRRGQVRIWDRDIND